MRLAVEGCAVLGARAQIVNLFSRAYGERRALYKTIDHMTIAGTGLCFPAELVKKTPAIGGGKATLR
jgi:hypothetical protein